MRGKQDTKRVMHRMAFFPFSCPIFRGCIWLVMGLLWMIWMSGCSHYSLTSSLPSHIKTVAIPFFEDRALEYGVSELLTDAVTDAFMRDHALTVVDEQRADSVLQGSLVSVQDEAMTYTVDENVEERRVTLRIDVTYYDLKKKKVIWEKEGIQEWASYDPADPSSRERGIEEAVQKLGREMLNLTLSDW